MSLLPSGVEGTAPGEASVMSESPLKTGLSKTLESPLLLEAVATTAAVDAWTTPKELSKKLLLKGSDPLAVMMSGCGAGGGREGAGCWEAFGARFSEVVSGGELVGVEVTGTFAGLETPRSCLKMK